MGFSLYSTPFENISDSCKNIYIYIKEEKRIEERREYSFINGDG
jgi:hypothetical protein